MKEAVEALLEQFRNPRIQKRFGWVLFCATKDNRTRPHHWALDGWVAAVDSPLFRVMCKVQSEEDCRCTLIPLDERKARRLVIRTEAELPEILRCYLD